MGLRWVSEPGRFGLLHSRRGGGKKFKWKIKKLNLGAGDEGTFELSILVKCLLGRRSQTHTKKRPHFLCERHESLQKRYQQNEIVSWAFGNGKIIPFNSFVRVCYKFKWKATEVGWKIASNHVHCIWWQFFLSLLVARETDSEGRFNEVVQSRREFMI